MDVPVVSIDSDGYLICDPVLDQPARIVPLTEHPRSGSSLRTIVDLFPDLHVDTVLFGSGRLDSLYGSFSDVVKSRMGWYSRQKGEYGELSQWVHDVVASSECTFDLLAPSLLELSGVGFSMGAVVDRARIASDLPKGLIDIEYRDPARVSDVSQLVFSESIELRDVREDHSVYPVCISRYFGVRSSGPVPLGVVSTTSPFR